MSVYGERCIYNSAFRWVGMGSTLTYCFTVASSVSAIFDVLRQRRPASERQPASQPYIQHSASQRDTLRSLCDTLQQRHNTAQFVYRHLSKVCPFSAALTELNISRHRIANEALQALHCSSVRVILKDMSLCTFVALDSCCISKYRSLQVFCLHGITIS